MKIKRRYLFLALILAIIFLVFLPHNNILNQFENAFGKSSTVIKKTNNPAPPETKVKKDNTTAKNALLAQLDADLNLNQQFSVSIYDINNQEFFGIRETDQFHSASVTKVLVATTALEEVEAGKYKLTTPLGGNTFEFHLQQMINQSNNNSWDLFNNLLGFKREQQEADKLGLTGVDIFQTHMTTRSIAQLLLKLYNGEVLTSSHRDLLFSYMQKTETENRISPSIPDGVAFYHKTGTFSGRIHDAAIVIHPKNPFILVLFTYDPRGIPDSQRVLSMQKAAQDVYAYFNSI